MTNYQNSENVLAGSVRVGIVTDINRARLSARVKYPETGMTSGWLYVLERKSFLPDYDGPQETDPRAGGSGEAAFSSHTHGVSLKPWMPAVNDLVLVLYLPVRDGDGFILGGIRKWQ